MDFLDSLRKHATSLEFLPNATLIVGRRHWDKGKIRAKALQVDRDETNEREVLFLDDTKQTKRFLFWRHRDTCLNLLNSSEGILAEVERESFVVSLLTRRILRE